MSSDGSRPRTDAELGTATVVHLFYVGIDIAIEPLPLRGRAVSFGVATSFITADAADGFAAAPRHTVVVGSYTEV